MTKFTSYKCVEVKSTTITTTIYEETSSDEAGLALASSRFDPTYPKAAFPRRLTTHHPRRTTAMVSATPQKSTLTVFDNDPKQITAAPLRNAPVATHTADTFAAVDTPELVGKTRFTGYVGKEPCAFYVATCEEVAPKDFRVSLEQVREIGGSTNMLARYPELRGRIFLHRRLTTLDDACDYTTATVSYLWAHYGPQHR